MILWNHFDLYKLKKQYLYTALCIYVSTIQHKLDVTNSRDHVCWSHLRIHIKQAGLARKIQLSKKSFIFTTQKRSMWWVSVHLLTSCSLAVKLLGPLWDVLVTFTARKEDMNFQKWLYYQQWYKFQTESNSMTKW